ncbi:MAG: polysaccharide biosynthesis C-terminal domain-containing protein [Acidimicrobiia bacterium]
MPTATADSETEPLPAEEAGAASADSRADLGSLARGGTLNLIGAAASGVLTFALVLVLTNALGPAGYGAFASAMGLFTIMSRTAELGADTGLVRTVARLKARGRPQDIRPTLLVALVPVLSVATLLGVALWLWAPELAQIFGKGQGSGQIADFARIFAFFLPPSAATLVLLSGTRGFGTMVPSVLVDKIGRPAIQPLLALAVVAGGLGTTAVALAFAVPLAVACTAAFGWLFVLLRKAERQAAKKGTGGVARPTRELAARFWRFTAPRGFAGIFQVTTLWLNTLLLGGIGSTREAGIFNAATRYVTAGLMVGVAIQQVLQPKLAELLALGDNRRAKQVYQASTAWLVTAVWPLYLSFALFSPALLRVFGGEFAAGENVLVVLGLTMLVATGVGTVDVVLLMGGKSSWNLYNTIAGLTVQIVLNLLLIPPLGVTGAALAWASSILVNNLAPLFQVWKFMGLHPFGLGFRRVAPMALVCYGSVGLALRLVFGASIPAFIAFEVLGGLGYLAALTRFRQDLELPVLWSELRRRRGDRRA